MISSGARPSSPPLFSPPSPASSVITLALRSTPTDCLSLSLMTDVPSASCKGRGAASGISTEALRLKKGSAGSRAAAEPAADEPSPDSSSSSTPFKGFASSKGP